MEVPTTAVNEELKEGDAVLYYLQRGSFPARWWNNGTIKAVNRSGSVPSYDVAVRSSNVSESEVVPRSAEGREVGAAVDMDNRENFVEKKNDDGTYNVYYIQKMMPADHVRWPADEAEDKGNSVTSFGICAACVLSFIYMAMVALGLFTAGPSSNRDSGRHTPFFFIQESGCNRRSLPWFATNYNMTLDANGWQMMPGWAMCPVSGVYNDCPNCLPDPDGGRAPTFGYTNCIYFNNDKFWTNLDQLKGVTKTSFGPDATFLSQSFPQLALAAVVIYLLYPVFFIFGYAVFSGKFVRSMFSGYMAAAAATTIATALWITAYVRVTQTAFASSSALSQTLFLSCSNVTVALDSGSKIHVACCVLGAFTVAILVAGVNSTRGAKDYEPLPPPPSVAKQQQQVPASSV